MAADGAATTPVLVLLGFLAFFAVGRFFVDMQRFSQGAFAHRRRFPLACPDCSPGRIAGRHDHGVDSATVGAVGAMCREIVAIAVSASTAFGAYLLPTTSMAPRTPWPTFSQRAGECAGSALFLPQKR